MASRLERLVSMDAYIRRGTYPSVQKLCDMFEVQQRTIYQDLRELREMFGLDIRYDRERAGYYNAEPSRQLPPLAMTYDEALLITLAIDMLFASFGPSLRSTLSRTEEMLRSNDPRRFAWMREIVHLQDRADCEVKCSVLTSVLAAAAHRQPTEFHMPDAERPKVAQPLRVSFSGGHWHIHAATNRGHEIKLPLCKIADVKPAETKKNGKRR